MHKDIKIFGRGTCIRVMVKLIRMDKQTCIFKTFHNMLFKISKERVNLTCNGDWVKMVGVQHRQFITANIFGGIGLFVLRLRKKTSIDK